MRRLLSLVVFPLVLSAAPGAAQSPQLIGTVGPGFTIDLADAAGKHVDVVVAGRYELLVHDLSDMHNFVLGSKATGQRYVDSGVEFVGDVTVTIDLTPGLYGYACSPHFQTMNGQLTVVAPAPPPSPPVETAEPLRATVGSASLTLSARRVAPGRYLVTVVDRSRLRNFHLVGPGVDRRTGKAFVGTVRWTLRLAAGTYRYGSDPKLSGRLVVG